MNRNFMIAQSGGPTAVINSSVMGAVEAALAAPEIDKVYGAFEGVQGLLANHVFDLTGLTGEECAAIRRTPSAALGSCRLKLSADMNDPQYEQIFKALEAYKVGYLFLNGGNDSMDTANKLNEYAKAKKIDIRIMGIPKTVDNDLAGTDHCPGFGSAAKYLNETLLQAAYDCHTYTTPTILLMETMGRHAGWLAASACLAEYNGEQIADRIYLPEVPMDVEKFLADTKRLFDEKGMVFIVVSEGVKNKEGQFLTAGVSTQDKFGHAQLGGVTNYLEALIAERITKRVKVVNPAIVQRCAAASASLTDWDEAYAIGRKSVECALNGMSGYMLGFERRSNEPYVCEAVPVPLTVAANNEQIVPDEYITEDRLNISEAGKAYLRPLIQGEVPMVYENGLPVFYRLKREFVTAE